MKLWQPNRRDYVMAGLLHFFNFVDYRFTTKAIEMSSTEVELNPFVRYIYEQTGNFGFGFLKLVIGVLMIMGLLYAPSSLGGRVLGFKVSLAAVTLIYGGVGGYHLVSLLIRYYN